VADYLEFFGLKSEPFESAGVRPLVLETGPLRRAVAWVRSELEAGKSLLCVHGVSGVGKTRLSSRAESVPIEIFERFEALQQPVDDGSGPLVAWVFLADERRVTPQLRRADATSTLAPLQPREIQRYLEARLLNAGFEGEAVFPVATCQAIFDATRGITGGVDLLCTTLLVAAARRGAAVIQPELVASSCTDADAPAEIATEQVGAECPSSTAEADAARSSDADLPRDIDDVDTSPQDPGLLAEHDAIAGQDEGSQRSAVEYRMTAPGGEGLEEGDETGLSDEVAETSPVEAPVAQEAAPLAAAPLMGIGTRWHSWPEWVTSGIPAVAAVLLAAVVVAIGTVVSFDETPDSVAPVDPSAAQIEMSEPPAELARLAPSTEAPVESRSADLPLEASEAAEVAEQAELAPAIEPMDASQPQEQIVVPDRVVAAPVESVLPGEVAEGGALPAAPDRTQQSSSLPESVEPRPSSDVASTVRPVRASPQKIAWPKAFLEAQQGGTPSPAGPARLEIAEPDLAGPSGVSR